MAIRLDSRRRPPLSPRPSSQTRSSARTSCISDELHFCCICGALILGQDLEDELDGESSGGDICGACNRTRNFDMEIGC